MDPTGTTTDTQTPAAGATAAPAERPGALGAVIMAWLVPGLGHLWIGRRAPALFVAVAVFALFVVGMALAGWENVSHVRHPWYFAIHALAGIPTLVADTLTTDVTIDRYYPHSSIGQLYTACAGLLNLIAATDVWARCRRGDPEGEAPAEPADAEPADAESAPHQPDASVAPAPGGAA